MTCTANIPLERFFLFPFSFAFFCLLFILVLLFCIWVSSTFLPSALGLGWIIYVMNLLLHVDL